MHPVQVWVLAARPKTLFASISPVLIGSVLSLSLHTFSYLTCFFTLFTALGIQIATNFVNDYSDYLKGADTSSRKGPMRVTQSGLVSLSTMKKATFLVFLLTSLCGLYLVYQGGIYIAFLLLLSLILAAAYTTGPYPLAYLGLGELFVLVFFGPVSVLGTYFLQTRTLSWEGLWIGIAVGFLSTAILAVANLRDIPEDRLVHKKTAAVRFGPLFAKLEYAVCLIIAAVIPLFMMKTHPFTCLSSLFLIPAIPCIKTVFSCQDPKQLNTILANTGKLLSLYTILFCMGWLIS